MRTLYIVPVIHTSADLGTLAPAIDQAGSDRVGQQFWLAHKATVISFWNSVADFVCSLSATGLKLFQDGLIAEGDIGLKIVEQGIRDGSKNYQFIGHLLDAGAELVRTEDTALVKREYELLRKVVKAESEAQRIAAAVEFRSVATELLCRRDRFIAGRIAATLEEGGTGVLFIGAYHDVASRLPEDILIREVKEITEVREYHALLADTERDEKRFEALAKYLSSPVNLPSESQSG